MFHALLSYLVSVCASCRRSGPPANDLTCCWTQDAAVFFFANQQSVPLDYLCNIETFRRMLNYHGLTREEGKEVLSFGEKNDVKTILQGAQQCSKIDYVFFRISETAIC